MNTALWVVQGILAAVFLTAGLFKTTQPIPKLAEKLAWVNAVDPSQVRIAGASELAASVGLILPGLTGIAGFLTPLAAVGLCAVMVLAARLHHGRDETKEMGVTAVFFVLAAFVAYGRFVAVPF